MPVPNNKGSIGTIQGVTIPSTSGDFMRLAVVHIAADGTENPASTTATATADGIGSTADSAVVGDTSGSVNAKLRGINKILNNVWDSVNSWLKVSIQNATLAVTQSGVWNVGKSGYINTVWVAGHQPAAAAQASASRAASGGTTRNVCTGFTASIAASTTAPVAWTGTVTLYDGSTASTTYLWGPTVLSLPATAGAVAAFVVGDKWLPGTTNTAMTLAFNSSGPANTFQSVTMDGTTST